MTASEDRPLFSAAEAVAGEEAATIIEHPERSVACVESRSEADEMGNLEPGPAYGVPGRRQPGRLSACQASEA